MTEILEAIRRKHPQAGTLDVCRGCGAPIYWLVSSQDKLTPIDIAPAGMKGNVVIDVDNGVWVHVATRPETAPENRHVTHFVTCPNAEEFRKRG